MKNKTDYKEALDVAIRSAKAAGEIQKTFATSKNFSVEHKGEIDLVTEVDIACEEAIIKIISEAYPEHGILTEEEGSANIEAENVWITDPLDGTTNFAHGFPVYCSSVALVAGCEPVAGAVYDPTRDELFTAVKGGGAFLNGSPIKVSGTKELINALLATGFPYSIKTTSKNNLKEFGDFAMRAQALRRPGAAAIDLCYVACGRLDGFWEFHLKPWDISAGALIVTEAGGTMSHSKGEALDVHRSDIVASNGLLHEAMLNVLAG